MGCHFLLQGIFLTQGWNSCLLHWQAGSLPLSHQGSPAAVCSWVYSFSLLCSNCSPTYWPQDPFTFLKLLRLEKSFLLCGLSTQQYLLCSWWKLIWLPFFIFGHTAKDLINDSLTRNWTRAPCSGISGSSPLDHQGSSPDKFSKHKNIQAHQSTEGWYHHIFGSLWKTLRSTCKRRRVWKGKWRFGIILKIVLTSWTPCKGLGDPRGLGSHLENCCCMLFPLDCCDLLTSSSFSFAINVFPSPSGISLGPPAVFSLGANSKRGLTLSLPFFFWICFPNWREEEIWLSGCWSPFLAGTLHKCYNPLTQGLL